jgi:hypothetical protein
VQLRGVANARVHGLPRELVQMWAARERIAIGRDA